MSSIINSHSSTNNAPTIARRDRLVGKGWGLFLDLDPQRGNAGERLDRALNEAARRCEAVSFLISNARVGSRWCKNALNLAGPPYKRLVGVLIKEGLSPSATCPLMSPASGRT